LGAKVRGGGGGSGEVKRRGGDGGDIVALSHHQPFYSISFRFKIDFPDQIDR